MNFREATESDLAFVGRHSISRGFFDQQPGRIEATYALDNDGKILAVGGYKLMNPHTAFVWFDLTEFARDEMVMVFQTIKQFFAGLLVSNGLRRLMAVVEPDFPEAIRTVEHFGFHREAILRNYFGEKDGFLYARIL